MSDMKSFNVKLPREIWIFLKKKAAEQETTMANIIVEALEKIKKKDEKNS